MTTKRLGRGLAELIDTPSQTTASFVSLKIEQIRPGRTQPREAVSEESLEELKASIKRQGVIEPVIVRPIAHGTYELVAGERRWKAAQLLGLQEIPAIVRALSDKQALEYALVENIQREDLNPIEEARGYARLLDEFGYTQEDIAAAVGKDRATVANILRLLKLPTEILEGIRSGRLTLGHAKVLVGIEDAAKQLELYQKTTKGTGLTVRQLEALASAWAPSRRRRAKRVDLSLKPVEDELRRVLGTKVTVTARKKGGRVVVDYFSQDDLARILQLWGISL